MTGGELGAEIQTFLRVGNARRELAAEWEPSSPGPAGPRHGDRSLFAFRPGEEIAG